MLCVVGLTGAAEYADRRFAMLTGVGHADAIGLTSAGAFEVEKVKHGSVANRCPQVLKSKTGAGRHVVTYLRIAAGRFFEYDARRRGH